MSQDRSEVQTLLSDPNVLLTPKEVSKATKMSISTIRRMRLDKSFPEPTVNETRCTRYLAAHIILFNRGEWKSPN